MPIFTYNKKLFNMKYLSILVLLVFISCSKEKPIVADDDVTINSSIPVDSTNKVLVLKLKYLNFEFVGGYELEFPDTTSFTVSRNYYPPGDFGSINIFYNEFNSPLFDGTIHWMGLGHQTFPESIINAQEFFSLSSAYPMPNDSLFNDLSVSTSLFANTRNDIWNAIDNLLVTFKYRKSNPNSVINILKYTPSVSIGNPADWYWIVILKN